MLASYIGFSGGLERTDLPLIAESTKEWDVAGSTFWLQATKLDGFQQVPTWKEVPANEPSIYPTSVSVMRDEAHLYVRVEARNMQPTDRVGVSLIAERGNPQSYFSIDRNGKLYALKSQALWETSDWSGKVQEEPDGYIAMFRIPLSLIEGLNPGDDSFRCYAKFGRLAIPPSGELEESSFKGVSITRGHDLVHWVLLSAGESN